MEEQQDYIELTIQPASHEHFMDSIRNFGLQLEVEIKSGMYRIYYDEPENLYRLGLLMARASLHDYRFLTNNALPANPKFDPPMPPKD